MNALQVKQYLYAGHWPIWCILDETGRVILCHRTEQETRKELETMRGKQ